MNQAATKHLENQTKNDSISENNNIFRSHEELIEQGTENEESIDFSYIDNETLSTLVEYERDYFKDYRMHLCLYKVDTTLRLPFVKYLSLIHI